MKNIKPIIYALISAIMSLLIFYFLFQLKYGDEWKNDGQSGYFIIIWSIGVSYVGYGISKKIINNKERVSNTENSNNENLWLIEKRRMLLKALKTAKFLFGVSAPIFLLAYLDNSSYLKSNLLIVVLLVLFTLICWLLEYRISKNLQGKI